MRAGEGTRVLLLAANLFVLLFGYYLLKTIREPLVLGENGGGAEVKSYAAALQALLLVGVTIAFSRLAARVDRMRLIAIVTSFFMVNLVLFFFLFVSMPTHRLALGIAFFIWVGCFNVMIIAQFWAFANDLHARDQGERLFPIIAGGSAIGAVAGAKLAKPLYLHFGPFALMLMTAGLLALCLLITWLVHRREAGGDGAAAAAAGPAAATGGATPSKGTAGGFTLMMRDRYLQLVGALSLIKNLANTTGEYILDRRLLEVTKAQLGTQVVAVEKHIAAYKSDYFTYVNLVVLILQLVAVSRVIKYLGVRRSLYILPLVALASYSTMAMVPVLTVILIGKVTENSVDYSLQKTVEQTLFLVTTREAKYKVKAVVDTFMVRFGDVVSAGLVWGGTHLGFGTLGFILANCGVVTLWLLVVVALTRAHKARADRSSAEAQAQPATAA
ncbi:MAG: putative inner rane protein [Myxococcales bacterium]|nr:putative inner rane protein [Myxococcales bacterium]